ncbi:unnamed protein product [[Candida] boidinii]|uniref:holo-[acyl-carrier-protein] synthase n=1 Tax=Candida boidinii TaxID=5477 RepID=A0A9W6WGJ3_CANBO|nr:hypothetical protein B5S33_g4706 [[Candida] boidinii]GME70342.1 unnamed protein product [[Candida] boidinii]
MSLDEKCWNSFEKACKKLNSNKAPIIYTFIIDVKKIDSIIDDFKFELILRLLGLNEISRIISKKTTSNSQKKILINKLLIKFLLSCQYKDIQMVKNKQMIRFGNGEFGKPFIDQPNKFKDNLQFNISDELDLIAISVNFNENLEIGIDLANPYDVKNSIIDNNLSQDLNEFHNEYFKDIFTNFEKLQLDKFNDNSRTDYSIGNDVTRNNDTGANNDINYLNYAHYWSIKESYSKYLGVGISNGLQYEFLNFKKFLGYDKNIIHMSKDKFTNKDNEIETFELIEDVISLNDYFQDKRVGTSRVLIETDNAMPMVLCVTHGYGDSKISGDEGIAASYSISDTHEDADGAGDGSPVQVKYIKVDLEQMVDYLVNISASPSITSLE